MQEWLSRNGFSRCSSGEFDRPDDTSVEQAFAALPRAFPAIVCAEHHRTLVLMGGIREMKMVFSDGGTVIERRERAQPAYQ
ncbi:hypothetical protein SISNIDRAFT_450180 [Sistotremastrum niveocremeum HHB9708]|uniref:Uncharacterized protein n=1 Tax=Sistotremastrum niveocremeum HHB9708 TaxID=1314777 RepID=A0A164YZC6_9AGAM|nr:hypothetical protein SISNIDRAFT_450180 [Sistotremastrum niveocremeum HHB9708]